MLCVYSMAAEMSENLVENAACSLYSLRFALLARNGLNFHSVSSRLVLYSTGLAAYSIIPYRLLPYRLVLHRLAAYRTVRTVPDRTVPYCTVPSRTAPHRCERHRPIKT